MHLGAGRFEELAAAADRRGKEAEAVGQRDERAMAEEARPKLSIKTERPVGQHVVPPSPTTLLDNGASRAP